MKKTFLGGMSPQLFLRDYWQKKPLLIRDAFPDFHDLLSITELMALASNDDAQARLVTEQNGAWQLQHGPFVPHDFRKLKRVHWSLLVQGINHFVPQAEKLLLDFNFIPHARLDDLMISYAPHGGSVGPHYDSYDVFLLQGKGHKHWQISAQHDMSLIPDAPLRILQKFIPEQEWILGPGDMLYLPPRYAHHGVALNDCLTYSIGFRAPSAQELATQFLVYLQDHIQLEGIYQDPDLAIQKHPAQISTAMLAKITRMLTQIHWCQGDIERFTGTYLTEPKPHIFFDPPQRPLSQAAFLRRADRHGVKLALKSQMLLHKRTVFINGEAVDISNSSLKPLTQLADQHALPSAAGLDEAARELLYQWYVSGYIEQGIQ